MSFPNHRQVGHCIYCGTKEGDLSREHIIPRGLFGKIPPGSSFKPFVLGRASCENCRLKTQEFETECQTKMLRNLRLRMGLSRRGTPEVRGDLLLGDGTKKLVTGHVEDFPTGIIVPLFNETPKLWAPDKKNIKPIKTFLHKTLFKPRNPALFAGQEIEMEYEIPSEAYQKMLAKIALGMTVLKFGPDYIKPIVTNFIRGEEVGGFGKYVFGLDPNKEPKPPKVNIGDNTYDTLYHFGDNIQNVDNVKYLVFSIRLFALYGAPTNRVIVGTLK